MLLPCCSREKIDRHDSPSCNRGGTRRRISSATCVDNIWAVPGRKPESVSGVSGGGWNATGTACGGGVWETGGVWLLASRAARLEKEEAEEIGSRERDRLDREEENKGSVDRRRKALFTAYLTGYVKYADEVLEDSLLESGSAGMALLSFKSDLSQVIFNSLRCYESANTTSSFCRSETLGRNKGGFFFAIFSITDHETPEHDCHFYLMLPTPDTSHVSFDNVYEPSEDSFLLLDTLSSAPEVNLLKDRFSTQASFQNAPGSVNSACPLVVEVGPGSGVVLAFLAANASAIFGRPDVLTVGIDVNEFACKATARTITSNIVATEGASSFSFLDIVLGSLTSCMRPCSVDLLIFNPPYVPSEDVPLLPSAFNHSTQGERLSSFERDNHLLALATDGGADGMEITWQLLDELPQVLSVRGVAYVLLCAQNRPEKVKARIKDWNDVAGRGKWDVQTVGTSGKTGGWEKLQIIRITRIITSL
ncbi:hypothetical protein FH972_022746 [Carpinus fangiana]|uniref:Methyltransferase small domain-containing protein n=1 Tax=Carpinus fangiana TaxID=176857 RepID=A0A5N6KTT9_9ROSI|nr:hypothetical protein FH972_022746 [Carpinus fangiana]